MLSISGRGVKYCPAPDFFSLAFFSSRPSYRSPRPSWRALYQSSLSISATSVDSDAVVLVDRRRRGSFAGIQHALHHALHRGDLHGGIAVRRLFLQLLDAEDVGEGLQAFHPRVLERVGGLLAERGAVDQEQHTPKALRLQQPVDQRDAGLGLAGPGRHREQHLALTLLDGGLAGQDCGLLVRPQREAVGEGRFTKLFVGAGFVALQQGRQAFGRVPAVQHVAQVVRTAQVAEPDAALCGQLPQIGAAVRRKHEWQAVAVITAAPGGRRAVPLRAGKVPAVAFGLLQGTRDVDIPALGLDRRHWSQADEQHIVGRTAGRRPFGDREVATLLRTGAGGIAERR